MFGLDKTASAIAGLIAAACLLAILMFGLSYCGERKARQEAEAGESIAQGRTVSAVEAIDKIEKMGERSDATDAEVEQAKENVRNAAPEDRARAFRYNACVLQHRTDCHGLL